MFCGFWNKKVTEYPNKDSAAVLQKQIFVLMFRVSNKAQGEDIFRENLSENY